MQLGVAVRTPDLFERRFRVQQMDGRMDDIQRVRREINEQMAPYVPRDVWSSTVSIVLADRPIVRQIGSGTLFRIADHSFVVTAAHVIASAQKIQKTIGIGARAGANLIATGGTWFSSESNLYDVAVYPLSSEQAALLQDMRFLELENINFDDPGPSAVFTIFGFPGIWSGNADEMNDSVTVKPFEFTTYAYDRSASGLIGFDPRCHILLSAELEDASQIDGSSVDFRTRDGERARFPIGLRGISGCSVWHIGDLRVPVKYWGRQPARLSGVATGVYHANGAIKSSRWATVTTLVHAAFPELRKTLDLWAAS